MMATLLPKPPICTEIYEVHCINKVSLMDARGSLYDCVDCLGSSTLGSEVATLSRLRYKHRNQLRHWKGLARLKQIQRCMKALNCTDLSKQLSQLLDMIPGHISSRAETKLYLPTASLIEYVRTRLTVAITILHQTIGYCLSAYQLMSQQLSQCLFVKAMTIMAAAISRVWILCRFLAERLGSCSEKLQVFLLSLNPPVIDPSPTLKVEEEEESDNTLSSSVADSAPVSTDTQDAYMPHLSAEKLVLVSEVIDRNWFNSIAENGVKATATASVLKAASVPLQCKSPLIRRVAKFLGNESALKPSPPKARSPLCILTVEESCSLMESLKACRSVSQLYLVLAKINRLRPGTSLRSMKHCLMQLKKLKTARSLAKERSVRRKNNIELLEIGRTIVERFIKKNQAAVAINDDGNDSLNLSNSDEHQFSDTCTKLKKITCHDMQQTNIGVFSMLGGINADEALAGNLLQEKLSANTTMAMDITNNPNKCRNQARTEQPAVANCKLAYLPKSRIGEFLSAKLASSNNVQYLRKLKHRLVKNDGVLRYGKIKVRLRKQNFVKVMDSLDVVSKDARKHSRKSIKQLGRVLDSALTNAKPV
jgi:hypothetical protein